jgi:hypothetical protein
MLLVLLGVREPMPLEVDQWQNEEEVVLARIGDRNSGTGVVVDSKYGTGKTCEIRHDGRLVALFRRLEPL